MKASFYFVLLQHRVLRNTVKKSIRCSKNISDDYRRQRRVINWRSSVERAVSERVL